MGSASDDVGVVERIGVHFGGDEAGHVSHVRQQDGVVRLANLFEPLVVQRARISREAWIFYEWVI